MGRWLRLCPQKIACGLCPALRPSASKKAMPQPSAWWSVQPPRWENPVKLRSGLPVADCSFRRSWHMGAVKRAAPGTVYGLGDNATKQAIGWPAVVSDGRGLTHSVHSSLPVHALSPGWNGGCLRARLNWRPRVGRTDAGVRQCPHGVYSPPGGAHAVDQLAAGRMDAGCACTNSAGSFSRGGHLVCGWRGGYSCLPPATALEPARTLWWPRACASKA